MANPRVVPTTEEGPDELTTSKECFRVYSEESNLEVTVKYTLKQLLTSVAKLEELGDAACKLLKGFQQALEFLRRPAINTTSNLIGTIIRVNESKRVKSYIEADCRNVRDRTEYLDKLSTCLLGLYDHVYKAKNIVNDVQHLMEDLVAKIQTNHRDLPSLINEFDQLQVNKDNVSSLSSSSSEDNQDFDVMDCVAAMGIICSMVKQDYVMQERIVSSLSLKSKVGELESCCVMWFLRPFIDDEVMRQAWKLIP